MTLYNINTDKPIHMPKRPDTFEFDEEVAFIFDNMARRSIPLYDESRRLAVNLTAQAVNELLAEGNTVTIVDVGASTGNFFHDLWIKFGRDPTKPIPNVDLIAIDNSSHMLDRLSRKVPHAILMKDDATCLRHYENMANVVNMAYVAQFLEGDAQRSLYKYAYQAMAPGGLLICAQKEQILGQFASYYAEEYIQFRRNHGYTMEEVEAKTAALKNSMWPMPYAYTASVLSDVGFIGIQEVSRWLQFSTLVARKPL